MKRTVIATLLGLVMGTLCAAGAFYAGLLKFTPVVLVWILLNRTVMGFAIGVSKLKVHWAWNGIVMGVVVGSIFSYYLYMTLGPGLVPPLNLVVNGIFGLLIEVLTTKVFKQPAFAVPQASLRAAA
jgi:hypothetical protein